MKDDQAPSAILELVDGPKDIRFAMTARTIARERGDGVETGEMTAMNIDKVTRYRPNGQADLEAMVSRIRELKIGERDNAVTDEARWGGKV